MSTKTITKLGEQRIKFDDETGEFVAEVHGDEHRTATFAALKEWVALKQAAHANPTRHCILRKTYGSKPYEAKLVYAIGAEKSWRDGRFAVCDPGDSAPDMSRFEAWINGETLKRAPYSERNMNAFRLTAQSLNEAFEAAQKQLERERDRVKSSLEANISTCLEKHDEQVDE